ncbi:MAG: CARDB domain-containing protein [Verrucomicrobiia bacterium]
MNSHRILFLVLAVAGWSVRAQDSDRQYAQEISSTEAAILAMTPDLATSYTNRLAAGSILMWSGPADRVPEGWVLCNGANGTPNLQEQFVMGAAGADEVGRAGGSEDHTHIAEAHSHNANVPPHFHLIPALEDVPTELNHGHDHEVTPSTGGVRVYDFGFGGESVAVAVHEHRLTWKHSHRHQFSVPRHGTARLDGLSSFLGSAAPVRSSDHIPPYMELCYIMKLAEDIKPREEKPGELDLAGRIGAARDSIASLKDEVKSVFTNAVHEGLVVLWSGMESLLPSGWRLCNGLGGTPNLQNRLILGAANALEAGDIGGSATHEHTTRAHQHTLAVPLHTHPVLTTPWQTELAGEHRHVLGHASSGSVGDLRTSSGAFVASINHTHQVLPGGSHQHEIQYPERFTDEAESSGWCGLSNSLLVASEHLPPHRKLRFLVKADVLSGEVPLNLAPADAISVVRVEALEKAVAQVRRTLNEAAAFAIPDGAIAAWAGASDAIPLGWSVCDGRNGTPDLRGRFVRGTARDPGGMGGSIEHSHLLGPHHHGVTFPHIHEIPPRNAGTLTDPNAGIGFDTAHNHFSDYLGESTSITSGAGGDVHVAGFLHGHYIEDTESTRHEHDVALQEFIPFESGAVGSVSSDTESSSLPTGNLPPYRKMLFIMKTGATNQLPPVELGTRTVASGSWLMATWSISNRVGTLPETNWSGRVFLSKDAIYDALTDRFVGEVQYDPADAVRPVYDASLRFAVPDVRPGHYYLLLVPEKTLKPLPIRSVPVEIQAPDLRPTAINAPEAADAGKSVDVSWTVQNQGNADARAPWYDRLFFCSQPVFDPDTAQPLGGRVYKTNALAGASYVTQLRATLPHVPAGQYYLLVQVDLTNSVFESVETNQFLAAPMQVRAPKLRPILLESVVSAEPGQLLTATWTVLNEGNADAGGTWLDRLYLSNDATAVRQLGTVMHRGPLAAGATYVAHLDFAMLAIPSGSYYLILSPGLDANDTNDVIATPIEVGQGGTIGISLAARVPDEELAIDLTWRCAEGRRYSLEFTPALGTVPFSCIASNLTATPPVNSYRIELRAPHGFYRLQEQP